MNEEQENTEDLKIGDDGAITPDIDNGTNIEVKTETPSGPEVNEADAPAEPEVIQVESTEPEVKTEGEVVENPEVEPVLEPEISEEPMATETTAEPESPFSSGDNTNETTSESVVNPITTLTETVANSTQTAGVASAQSHVEHRNNKKLAVILTIVVALLLAGAAVYVYISAEENTAESPNTSQNNLESSTEETVTPATSNDVDQAITEVDETLDTIDSETNSNLSEETVSDQNLGLE